MNWQNKVFVQRVCSKMPNGDSLYYLLQKHFGALKNFKIDSKISQAKRMCEVLHRYGYSLEGKALVEIGSGWVPCLPMAFWVMGYRSCKTYDISSLLKDELVFKAIFQLISSLKTNGVWDELGVTISNKTRKIKNLESFLKRGISAAEILQEMNIECVVRDKFEADYFGTQSADVVFSNTTLEHIPSIDLESLLKETYQVLKPGGISWHLIDPSDHFAHTDLSISPINFLKYSNDEFEKYNNRYIYQNRLRNREFKELFQAAGYEIVAWETKPNERSLRAVDAISLDSRFLGMPREEICSGSVIVIARKPSGGV